MASSSRAAAHGGVIPTLSEGELNSTAQRERRRRILDSTLALASKGGYDAVQMRAVADRADVAVGTLYRYFPSKVHLLVSALAREFERINSKTDRRMPAGLTVQVVGERVFDDEVPEGAVVEQEPVSGQVERGSSVRLVISKGPELVTVPSVVGQQFERAKEQLEALGLEVEREDVRGGFFGTVREQSVEPGTHVPKGTEIVVRVV